MSRRVTVRFFKPAEFSVFKKCLNAIPGANDVIVQPLWRIGASGARVFAFYPNGPNSLPHVGKIHTRAGIEREKNGLKRAYPFFPDAQSQIFVANEGDLGMLAIQLIRDEGASGTTVTELKDRLFSFGSGSAESVSSWRASEHKVLNILDTLYSEKCELSFRNVTTKSRRLQDEYEWYLRKNRTENIMRTWLGSERDKKNVNIYGATLPNPLLTIRKLLALRRNLPLSTVHGDLHPSNVMLDRRGEPHLIDFSWCSNDAHILKDFLVMECSVRFLMIPQRLGHTARMILDKTLIDPTQLSVKKMLARLKNLGVDKGTLLYVERCAKIVMKLREQARRACGDQFDIRDYLGCQAIVLFGLMCLDNYPFGISANALGLIGKRLHETGYFDS
jgi:hypothetical protein